MNRREFIRTTVVTAAAGSTAACGGDEEIARPAGVPVGPFGRDATAESERGNSRPSQIFKDCQKHLPV